MKKFVIICLLFLQYSFVDAPAQIKEIDLPEIVFESKSYDREIFDVSLALGADSTTARIIVAQARLESGDFTNRLTRNHNNVFSMQHPRKRITTSLGPLASAEKRKNIYASYYSVKDAVIDLFLYFKARKITLTQHSITRYVKLLKSKRFFEGDQTDYRDNLRKHYKKSTV